ncbi:hypothetical protein L6452_15035 [Arctium lappa]|uniref:Uncharacterized protein n=1 Tax=Arctium lappa TaxID=4217 RepID=A0ACB9CMM4_ARCLA|nr:hypothetical protein L6452_15035 [Arctium lappa]
MGIDNNALTLRPTSAAPSNHNILLGFTRLHTTTLHFDSVVNIEACLDLLHSQDSVILGIQVIRKGDGIMLTQALTTENHNSGVHM